MPEDQPKSPDAPGPGTVLADRYELGAVLGVGGMGRVLAARDRKLQRDVAVKLLSAAAPDPDVLRRFAREALAASAVQHPNVVAVFDAGEHQGRPFLVTELLRGRTLRDRLRGTSLPAEEAARIARQVAAGLAAAHEKGFTHRDLKPENLFLTDDGWVKILDFGLVKLTQDLRHTLPEHEARGDDALTAAGRTMGTVGYMAPEQVRGKPVDPRADVFNLGAVLYEMLAGTRAFKGASPTEVGYAILMRQPEPLPASVPRALRELVARCLEKDRDKRIATAREVLEALDGRPASQRTAPVSPAIRRGLLLGAVLAGLAAVLLFGGARLRGGRKAAGAAPPAGTVAILPFSTRDVPRFAWLSEGVVDLLARDLEGRELRAVDAASVLRAVGGDETADVDRVRGAAAQAGAKYFVLGRVEQRRGSLVLEAVLHDASGEPVSQAVAQGSPDDVLRLVRSLSDQLQLRPLPKDQFDARLDRLAHQTSRSPLALQAWLEGERLLRRHHWNESLGAFQRAVAADPEFALARYRIGVGATVLEPGMAEDALRRALSNSDRLAPFERPVAEAQLAVHQGYFDSAERLLIEATRRFPDSTDAWLQLGELYYHSNPLRARSAQEAVSPFQSALLVDPVNTEAMVHLIDLAQSRGERTLVSRLSDRMLALSDEPATTLSVRLAQAWARGDSAASAAVLAELRRETIQPSPLHLAFVRAAWQMDGFADAEAIASMFGSTGSAGAQKQVNLGLVALMRGQPQAARTSFARALEIFPGTVYGAFLLPWVDTLDFVASTPAQLVTARQAAARIDVGAAPNLGPMKQYLAGALAARAGDSAAAEAEARALEQAPLEGSSIAADLALAVRARVAAAAGDSALALSLLMRQQHQAPARYSAIYSQLAENRLRASLLKKLGRLKEALPLYEAVNFYNLVEPALVPAGLIRQALLLEALGDPAAAMEKYAKFVEVWKDCERAEQPELELARTRLAQLRGPGASAVR